MLREIPRVRQIPGEAHRRWFTDERMDLFVWSGEQNTLNGFQLSYDKSTNEKAITFKLGSGFLHTAVDDGARPGQHPGSPLLVADGSFDAVRVRAEFLQRAEGLDESVVQFVESSLKHYEEKQRHDSLLEETPIQSVHQTTVGTRWIYIAVIVFALVLLAWLANG